MKQACVEGVHEHATEIAEEVYLALHKETFGDGAAKLEDLRQMLCEDSDVCEAPYASWRSLHSLLLNAGVANDGHRLRLRRDRGKKKKKKKEKAADGEGDGEPGKRRHPRSKGEL